MEFIVNESGCHKLSLDMMDCLKQIATLVSEVDSNNSTLRAALGEDYDSIANSVQTMTSELNDAYNELNIIISDMESYMSQVHQARISLE